MSIVTDNIKTDSYLSKDGTREYGRATAWVNFDGTGVPTIRDSLNVASITDNGTGDYTVNFSQAMADTNYTVVATGGSTGSHQVAPRVGKYPLGQGGVSTLSAQVSFTYTDSLYVDPDVVCVQIFGGDANV